MDLLFKYNLKSFDIVQILRQILNLGIFIQFLQFFTIFKTFTVEPSTIIEHILEKIAYIDLNLLKILFCQTFLLTLYVVGIPLGNSFILRTIHMQIFIIYNLVIIFKNGNSLHGYQ